MPLNPLPVLSTRVRGAKSASQEIPRWI